MSILKVTPDFIDFINSACSSYKAGWAHIQKYDLLNKCEFWKAIDTYGLDASKCCEGDPIFEGAPTSESKWKQVISVIKKLQSMQSQKPEDVVVRDFAIHEVATVDAFRPLDAKVIAPQDANTLKINALTDRVTALEAVLSKTVYLLNELRDQFLGTLNAPSSGSNDAIDFMEALGFDADDKKHTPEELEAMRDASMDDFEHIVKHGTPVSKSSSKGVIEKHAIHSSVNVRSKGNDISADHETATSVVYDTENPCATRRDVELREAKQAVANVRKEKGAPVEEHPNSDEERKQRWLDAVRKSRIQRGMGVDVEPLQQSGFDCEDPHDSIFQN